MSSIDRRRPRTRAQARPKVEAPRNEQAAPPSYVAANVPCQESTLCAWFSVSLTYDTSSNRWVSGPIPISAATGPDPIELRWQDTAGRGTFGFVARPFSGRYDLSGSVNALDIRDPSGNPIGSAATGSTVTANVSLATEGPATPALTTSDAPVVLVPSTSSTNPYLVCSGTSGSSAFLSSIEFGCANSFSPNPTLGCPDPSGSTTTCVPIATGSQSSIVTQGLNTRIACSPNNWSQFPVFGTSDPRLVRIFELPLGLFGGGAAASTAPVVDLPKFYITGWSGDTCAGDDAAPKGGAVVGHFVP
jgi:hypothetical protein